MGKRKNSMQSHLLANSLLFGILSVAALSLGLFFFYFGLVFSVLAISVVTGEFALMTYLQAGLFIAASLIIFYVFARNSKWLWAQWNQKWAIEAEEERVLRLVDESADDDSQDIERSETIQQYKR